MNSIWQTLERETDWSGTDIHATNRAHKTALRAALEHHSCHKYVPFLLEQGSDVNHTHPVLLPILHTAVLYAPQYINMLLSYGADPFVCDNSGNNLFDCVLSCSPRATQVLLENNIGVFEIRRRYYDPQWENKIPQAVCDVVQSHINAQRAHGSSGVGQFRAIHTTPNKSSSLG